MASICTDLDAPLPRGGISATYNHCAFIFNHHGIRAIAPLLAKGADCNMLLHICARENDVDGMKACISLGRANVHARIRVCDNNTETCLHIAAMQGSVDAVEFLCKSGVDPNVKSTNQVVSIAPIWIACRENRVRCIRLLAQAGADLNSKEEVCPASIGKTNITGGSPALCAAVKNGHVPALREMLRQGAEPDRMALMVAVQFGQVEMVALLRSAGVKLCEWEYRGLIQVSDKCSSNSKIKSSIEALTLKDGVRTLLNHPLASTEYKLAQVLECNGDYRSALSHIATAGSILLNANGPPPLRPSQRFDHPAWCQLLYDEERLRSAVYGVPHCDSLISSWRPHVFDEDDVFAPEELLFYAGASNRHDGMIYRHGGLKFLKQEEFPSRDEFWALNGHTMKWSKVETTNSPGPRAEHVMVLYKDHLYIIGGRMIGAPAPMNLHKLDLKTKAWSAVKVSPGGGGIKKPPARYEAAACVYKDKLYLHGGELAVRGTYTHEFLNDIWCFDFAKSQWTELISKKGKGKTPPVHQVGRKNHAMWGARGKLWLYGGTVTYGSHAMQIKSVRSFRTFDLETRQWESHRCVGYDPWELSEFCLLPLYHGQKRDVGDDDDDEPHSVFLHGGYREKGQIRFIENDTGVLQDCYGDEVSELIVPYVKRTFRFDIDTLVWSRLDSNGTMIQPTAQCFAVELSNKDNITRLVVGGGYGLTPRSKMGPNAEDVGLAKDEVVEACIRSQGQDGRADYMAHPTASRDLFEVAIHDGGGPGFAEKVASGVGWEWSFYNSVPVAFPRPVFEMYLGSASGHWMKNIAEDDFRKPGKIVKNDDQEHALGARVVLKCLQGRQDLNGKTGRCGPWLPDRGRYHVTVYSPRYKKEHVFVRSSNLVYADPLDENNLGHLMKEVDCNIAPYCVTGGWALPLHVERHCLLEPFDFDMKGVKVSVYADTYRGPLSSRALALLEYIKPSIASPDVFMLTRISLRHAKNIKSGEELQQFTFLENFIAKMRAEDSKAVTEWTTKLIARRDESSWPERVFLKLKLDGLDPGMQRTLLVSTSLSIAELHHQVLAPAIGWQRHHHAYAIRRIYSRGDFGDPRGQDKVLSFLEKEKWVGPSFSTALDVYFQFLYIGGAVANDRKILLGDLLYSHDYKPGEVRLQYVHDFGDWWSHSIEFEPYKGDTPTDGSAASLMSGSLACPPEDTNGVLCYFDLLKKLKGLEVDTKRSNKKLDPSMAEWWKLVNEEYRPKPNMEPLANVFEFNLEKRQQAVKQALTQKLEKPGIESYYATMRTTGGGMLQGAESGPGGTKQRVNKKITDPLKFCAFCGTTAALKVCSGCKLVSFCGRDHQLQAWPSHKAACKARQKELNASSK